MDEYNKINWKENPLEDNSIFLNKEDFSKSYIYKCIKETVNKADLKVKDFGSAKICLTVPGQRFYSKTEQFSKFDSSEHIKLINAHKLLTSGKQKFNGFEKEDLTFYNSVRPLILTENTQYLKHAEEAWNKLSKKNPLKLKAALRNYAIQQRLTKLKQVYNLPQYYKHVDTISYTYSEQDTPIEMMLTENILDVGKVAKFYPPELVHTYIYKVNTLPKTEENLPYFKLPVSQDKHIEEIIKHHDADIVISLTSLKQLIDFNDNSKEWIMPVVIKETINANGSPGRKVIFVDKPLPKVEATNIDFNKRCAKLFSRTNFCCMDGLSYCQNEAENDTESDSNTKEHNVINNASYKIWTLGQKVENSALIKGFKNFTFKVLIRTKIDACEFNEQGIPVPVIVTPKLEYQLNYGASICSKSELAREWTALFFQPFSTLYRVRSDYNTCEVIQIESCSMQKINNEAFINHTMKPHLGLGVLYKVFYELKQWPNGNYLLNYNTKREAFMDLLQESNQERNSFDLHSYYTNNSKMTDEKFKPWSPIDVNILLPIFEYNKHMCGLCTPCKPKSFGFKKNGQRPGNKNCFKKKAKNYKKKKGKK